jgi:tRNA pseudouridine13 synthase
LVAHLPYRFTDFLVFEVDQDNRVIHLKSLNSPEQSGDTIASQEHAIDDVRDSATALIESTKHASSSKDASDLSHDNDSEMLDTGDNIQPEDGDPWPKHFTTTLSAYLSTQLIEGLKQMYLEGSDPPFVSDSGWEGCQARGQERNEAESVGEQVEEQSTGRRGKGRRGRGVRSNRGRGARNGRNVDTRKVVSEVRTF